MMSRGVQLRELHEIELSSRCNLACVYCPHPKLERAKEDMTSETFHATCDLLRHLVNRGTQTEVSLTGIGEAALHPLFVPWASAIRAIIGGVRPLVISTNGICFVSRHHDGLADAQMRELARLNPVVYVSLHRPELATPALARLKQFGIVHSVNVAFATSSLDWAGQVAWKATMARSECQYLRRGWGVVRADGRITTCCMDAHTKHSFGTVRNGVDELYLKPHALCGSCQLDVPRDLFPSQPELEGA